MYKVLLPYERYGPDMSWVRVPILILGLFVVAITQGECEPCSRECTAPHVGDLESSTRKAHVMSSRKVNSQAQTAGTHSIIRSRKKPRSKRQPK